MQRIRVQCTKGERTSKNPSAAASKRIVRRIPEEIATEKNLDAVDEVFTGDAVDEVFTGDPVDHTPMAEFRGREEIKAQFEMIFSGLPDLTVTVEDLVAEGDTVAVRVSQRGTHRGEFLGIEPTGNQVDTTTHAFVRLEGRMVAERWIQSDQLRLLTQVGVVEPPEF